MMRFYVTVALVIVLGSVGVVMGAFNEPDWGFQFDLDEPARLDCNHSTLVVVKGNYVKWELPDGKVLEKDNDRFDLVEMGEVENMRLTVKKLQESDAGVYICHVFTTKFDDDKRGQLLRGLNLGGPSYPDLFDKYRNNLMVGGIAALVLFVPLCTLCFLYKFRYQTKEQKREKHAARLENTKHQRHLENNGTGAELSEVAVFGSKGESNEAYSPSQDEIGTRL